MQSVLPLVRWFEDQCQRRWTDAARTTNAVAAAAARASSLSSTFNRTIRNEEHGYDYVRHYERQSYIVATGFGRSIQSLTFQEAVTDHCSRIFSACCNAAIQEFVHTPIMMKRSLIFAGLVVLIAVACRAQTTAPDDSVRTKELPIMTLARQNCGTCFFSARNTQGSTSLAHMDASKRSPPNSSPT